MDLLHTIRQAYAEAGKDSAKGTSFLAFINSLPAHDLPEALYLAYQAAGEAFQARNSWLPWAKLAHFKQAMQLFAQAISLAPVQVEVRFLRYTIQKNTPSFLGFTLQTSEDAQVILQHLNTCETEVYMKKDIASYLLQHERWSNEEAKILQAYL